MTVRINDAGLVLDDKEQVLLCASLFYFRIPSELWRSRLEQVHSSGYHAIDVYLPWNFHESAPGEWDFTGRRDAARFLDLAAEVGLTVIARPGPYICSEWDGGALPAWLGLTDGLRQRQAEDGYLDAVRSWFDQVMPIIAARQYGAGGSVIAVQIENELDFFDTEDRHAYMSRLHEMTVGHGIEVPVFACAGQGDLTGATGGAPGVAPAFNFYPSDSAPHIEETVRRYTSLLAERELPLLVTETNRAHVTLRRLLVSGAKLLAPYLQASGYNFGYYPSAGNWGDPGSFMSHDYDFGGYLSPVGEPREEFAEARALTGLVDTLGVRLARATAEAATDLYTTAAITSSSPSQLRLDGGGTLLGIPNLGDQPATVSLHAVSDLGTVEISVAPHSCALVLRDLPLMDYGVEATLRLATADVVSIAPSGIELVGGQAATVVVADHASGDVVHIPVPAPQPGAPAESNAEIGGMTWRITLRHLHDLVPVATTDAQSRTITAVQEVELPTGSGVESSHEAAPSAESVGVFRGRVHYETSIAEVSELLFAETADIVDVYLDGQAAETWARFGATHTVAVGDATSLRVSVETWGHANFDDSRLPALQIGSLRGIGRVWSVETRRDIGVGWFVGGERQWAGDPAPLSSLGGWSSTRVGQEITFHRVLELANGRDYAIHLPGLGMPVTIRVGEHSQMVVPENPWVHFVAQGSTEISVTAPHVSGTFSGAELLTLVAVEGWQVTAQNDAHLIALAAESAPTRESSLPVRLTAGEERWLELHLPPGGHSLRFDGIGQRVSVFGHDELLGRVWLEDPARPRFSGGNPERIWLPAAWNDGVIRLLLHADNSCETTELRAVEITPSQE